MSPKQAASLRPQEAAKQTTIVCLKQAIPRAAKTVQCHDFTAQALLHSHVCSETDVLPNQQPVFIINSCRASPDSHMTEAGNPQKGAKQYRWGAPYREQLRILFTRTIKTRRFEALSTRDFLQFLIVGVLAGTTAMSLALSWHARHDALPCPLIFIAMPHTCIAVPFIVCIALPVVWFPAS